MIRWGNVAAQSSLLVLVFVGPAACRVFPCQGLNSCPASAELQSLNHWTTREVPLCSFLCSPLWPTLCVWFHLFQSSLSVFVSVNLGLFPSASITVCVSASLSAVSYISLLPLSICMFLSFWSLCLPLPALPSLRSLLGLTSPSL